VEFPLLVPAIRLDRDAAAEEAAALGRAREPWVAGFLLFGGEAEGVRRLTDRLRDAAGRPIFVASDMERGAGQQVKGLRVLAEAGVWGLAASPQEAEAFGEITARDARSVGVDVLFAPVVDVRSEPRNPIVGNRAFGWDPDRVARWASAFCRGALRGGAAPTAKHYPGHGATVQDSHDAVPVVREEAARVLARDLEPFLRVVREGGCPAVMTAHVAFPALDRRGRIATFSAPTIDRLRAGVPDPDDVAVFTDALLMAGALGEGSETDAARKSLEAGCDLLLYPEDPEAVAAGILAPGADGGLRERAERATGRVRGLLGRIAIAREEAVSGPEPAGAPLEVARRAVYLGGGDLLSPERDWVLVLDDDDVPSRGAVLSEMGRRAGVPVTVIRLPKGERPSPLAPVAGGRTVVVTASIRAWKGAPDVSPLCREVVEGLARTAREAGQRLGLVWLGPSPGPGGIHVPGTGPDVERALGERLFPSEPRVPP
jgi:beta-glucosidase-like glycosyl hydrolase